MNEFVLPHCAKITINFRDGQLFIEQDHEQTEASVVNVPSDRIPAFLQAIRNLCESNGIATEIKAPANINGHQALQKSNN
jgi:hypothetical protein